MTNTLTRAPRAYKPRKDINLKAWQVPPRPSEEALTMLRAWILPVENRAGGWTCFIWHSGNDNRHWIELDTIHGSDRARPGDWIVQGPAGFFIRSDPQFRADYVET